MLLLSYYKKGVILLVVFSSDDWIEIKQCQNVVSNKKIALNSATYTN